MAKSAACGVMPLLGRGTVRVSQGAQSTLASSHERQPRACRPSDVPPAVVYMRTLSHFERAAVFTPSRARRSRSGFFAWRASKKRPMQIL